jgi:hypothetical protein
MSEPCALLSLGTSPASDSWGFVGTVMIGEYEAYRTIRAYSTPQDALAATQALVARVLGTMLAGEEWRSNEEELGHAPRRAELGFGLHGLARRPPD